MQLFHKGSHNKKWGPDNGHNYMEKKDVLIVLIMISEISSYTPVCKYI